MIGDEPVADVKTCNEKYEFCDSHYMGLTEPNLVGDCPKDCPVCKDYKCYPLAPTDLFCPEGCQYCSWESKDETPFVGKHILVCSEKATSSCPKY